MNEIFLLKLGEIVLKGQNRKQFESKLRQNVRRRMKPYGEFDVYIIQSTVYVEPKSLDCDLEGAWEACHFIFGVVSLCRCRPCEKNLDRIFEAVEAYLGEDLECAQSFKVESKRSDKAFPLTSIGISQEIGGRLAEAHPHLQVDVHRPQYTVYVEVRDLAAYVHGPAEPGAGGLPTGVGGRAAVLLSGGIDSPVAAYMIAKRGVEIECIHFFSYPYTSEQARDKVLELARLVTRYCGRMTVDVVGFTEIQEAIRDGCPEEYFTLIMRRFMMRIAQRIALEHGCKCLVTGENLGQVASQTMEAMGVTGAVVSLPLFTPLIGMDKEEIVTIARRIGTLETSILPYEDCCTVFTPKHPKTKPTLAQVEQAEAGLDVEALISRALEQTEKVMVRYDESEADLGL
ncbi:MAG: tRNA uracil 4-sulfurtransferase ThiI [Oscillospiraceae bacterium]|jgi:thiamine biosynthesis protein ThiI